MSTRHPSSIGSLVKKGNKSVVMLIVAILGPCRGPSQTTDVGSTPIARNEQTYRQGIPQNG
jgi:hypothetical protein